MLNALKRLVEIARPDLSTYMRFPVLGEVTAVDAVKFTCDVQPQDISMSLLPKCRILSIWATKTRRVVALPAVGDKVMVGFEDGDHGKAYIQGFLPEQGLSGQLLIEAEQAQIMIENNGRIKVSSNSDVEINCANCTIKASGTIDLGVNSAGVVTSGPQGTMPVCFVTGAPIPCSATVKAKR